MDRKITSYSSAWRRAFQEVDDILSKVHSTDYKGNPSQPGDPSFDDASKRLQRIALVCGDTEILLFDEYKANMLIFDEIMSRQEAMDRQGAKH